MNLLAKFILLSIVLALVSCSDSPQQADPDFKPENTKTTFTPDNSPVVLVDEAHSNFLTIGGRYKPFEQVLLSDGFTVKPNTNRFTLAHLKHADILVIANALDYNRKDWRPPYGSALDEDEVASVKQWVIDGGSLLLIADHTPFPKVVANLALAFGFEFSNGHVGPAMFRRTDNTLSEHSITSGESEASNKMDMPVFMQETKDRASPTRQITLVKTFGGSAFKAPKEADVLMKLGPGVVSTEPEIPFQINSSTPRIPVEGWSQGAVMNFGKGRVAVFSEGMMFSSQLDGKTGKKYGLKSVGAQQNERFFIRVMHWLSDVI